MKKIIIMAAALLLGLQGMNAQTENDENDDIITVTDKDGKSEEIEIPEEERDKRFSFWNLQSGETWTWFQDEYLNKKNENQKI